MVERLRFLCLETTGALQMNALSADVLSVRLEHFQESFSFSVSLGPEASAYGSRKMLQPTDAATSATFMLRLAC